MIETTMKKVETMAWMATSKCGMVNLFLKEPKMTEYGDYYGIGLVTTLGTVGIGYVKDYHYSKISKGIDFPKEGNKVRVKITFEVVDEQV